MKEFKIITKTKIAQLPKTSGVYLLASPKPNGEGGFEIIYIGKAINIKNRVKNHFQQPSYRDNLFITKISKIGFIETGSEIEALILEANLIKKYQPKFNVIWKDDKNYFYVAITQPLPVRQKANGVGASKKSPSIVYITHQKTEKAEYIGPFVEGIALKKTLRFLRKALPYYTTKKHSKNNCTYCHLGLCPGPNPDFVEYKKNIKKLILILKGKKNNVLNSLKKEMRQLSFKKEFEKAAKIRDRIYNLQQIMNHTRVIEFE
ncbi:MAG: UvrB/UvrC motif-containing protein, partial [Candidatus Parcubacteria bacterium]|nr:UvrB/UvrC motif-containing protein [Candidatus Parcubacteria bacterium]